MVIETREETSVAVPESITDKIFSSSETQAAEDMEAINAAAKVNGTSIEDILRKDSGRSALAEALDYGVSQRIGTLPDISNIVKLPHAFKMLNLDSLLAHLRKQRPLQEELVQLYESFSTPDLAEAFKELATEVVPLCFLEAIKDPDDERACQKKCIEIFERNPEVAAEVAKACRDLNDYLSRLSDMDFYIRTTICEIAKEYAAAKETERAERLQKYKEGSTVCGFVRNQSGSTQPLQVIIQAIKGDLFLVADPDNQEKGSKWKIKADAMVPFSDNTFESLAPKEGDEVFSLYHIGGGEMTTQFYLGVIQQIFKKKNQVKVAFYDGDAQDVKINQVFKVSAVDNRILVRSARDAARAEAEATSKANELEEQTEVEPEPEFEPKAVKSSRSKKSTPTKKRRSSARHSPISEPVVLQDVVMEDQVPEKPLGTDVHTIDTESNAPENQEIVKEYI